MLIHKNKRKKKTNKYISIFCIITKLSLEKFFNSHDLYSFLHQSKTSSPTSFSWKLIWKTHCPPKISIFLWKIAWDALPTRCILYHRSILHTSDCPSCPSPTETSIHCLRDCLVAKEFWLLCFSTLLENFFTLELSSWLELNLFFLQLDPLANLVQLCHLDPVDQTE